MYAEMKKLGVNFKGVSSVQLLAKHFRAYENSYLFNALKLRSGSKVLLIYLYLKN